MPEGQELLPLRLPKVEPFPPPAKLRPKVIEETWRMLEDRLRLKGVDQYLLDSARTAYVAGVYSSAAAVLNERAHYQELTAAAKRLDR